MNNVNKPEQIPGVTCPGCGNFIPTTIAELLTAHSLRCPTCSLQLMIDRQQSRKALDALQKVQYAQERVRKTENFNR